MRGALGFVAVVCSIGAAGSARAQVGVDLVVDQFTGDMDAYAGAPISLELRIRNDGDAGAFAFQYAYFVEGMQIWLSTTTTVAPHASLTLVDSVPLPMLPSGPIEFSVILDIFSVISEERENNNFGTFGPVIMHNDLPDLSAEFVEDPFPRRPGDDVDVARTIRNTGVTDAVSFRYAYYLSEDAIITTADRLIAELAVPGLPAGGEDRQRERVHIPASVLAGTYHLGIIVDAAQAILELDETNNSVASAEFPLNPSTGIRIETEFLSVGTVGFSYFQQIIARAGGPILFSISSGSLPSGLVLHEDGLIDGTPEQSGDFFFRVRAETSMDSGSRDFSITIFPAPPPPLVITTSTIPEGAVGEDYSAQLEAEGGAPPLRWGTSSQIPEGLELTTEGELRGRPREGGARYLSIAVGDMFGSVAMKSVYLYIEGGEVPEPPPPPPPPPPPLEVDQGGCSCSAASSSDLSWWIIAAGALGSMRRSRRR